MMADGTGYFQSKFAATCPGCHFSFNRENLAVLKVVRDIVIDPRNEKDKKQYDYGVYLAYASLFFWVISIANVRCYCRGTVRSILNPIDDITGTALKIKLHVVFPPPGGDRETVSG